MDNKRRIFVIAGVIILMIIFSSFTSIINFITDYKWFSELGFTQTFLTKLKTQLTIGITVFIVFFILISIYLNIIKKKYYRDNGIQIHKSEDKKFNLVIRLASAGLSLFIASVFARTLWFSILQYINSTNFNLSEPIFKNDISFYIFKLPLISDIMNLLLLLVFLFTILTVGFYLVLLSIRRPINEDPKVFDFEEFAKGKGVDLQGIFTKKLFKNILFQIATAGFFVLVIIGINYMLRSYNLLYSSRGKVFGASYTDVHVTLNVYRIMGIVALLSSVTFFIGILKRKNKLALLGPALLIVIAIVGNIGAFFVEKYIVEPDQISKESPYLAENIEFTQNAYGLDNVTEKQFPVNNNLTKEALAENTETIKNIRINDYRPLRQVYNQLQGIRPYYKFNDIDVGRYNIDGEYTQVFLSARELDQNQLSEQAKNWINLYLKYTHGYGLTLSPVNSVSSNGQPRLLVRDIPPKTETDLLIERPEIYFGEMTNDYIIVNTDEEEFDYPQGSDNVSTRYNGNAGIKLSGINKILYAIKQGDLKLLISTNINSDSRIILYRNIKDRVRKIAPFIQYDSDPYLIVNQEDGKLYWIIDGYTVSSRYPYSQPFGDKGINYIRNSVKVVIDAYNGDVNYYTLNDNDPIISTYSKIFTDLFKSIDNMPEGLRVHTRYPQQLFNIQSEIYKAYHMNNPEVFFSREDYWAIAKEKYMEDVQQVESNYVMFKLPEEEKAEFLLTVPYTPNNKNNMTALFVARSDGEQYGDLILYKFPKDKNIPGPMQVESKIDQDTSISSQLSLWDQKGSAVLRGNVMVIPIEDSLLYVEPIYLMASNENSLPEVKRVIVSYKDRIVMENNLDAALLKIFGEDVVDIVDKDLPNTGDTDVLEGDIKEIAARANELFILSKEASQNGDWAKYGEYIEELEKVLSRLNNLLTTEDTENVD